MGLNALANNGVAAFMTTYMTTTDNFSQEAASIIFGVGPLIGIVGALAAGFLSSKVDPEKSLMLIYFGQVTFLLGFVFLPSTIFTAASFLMYQFFLSAVWTPANSLVVSLMGEMGGGTAYSFFFFSHDAPGAISPLIAAVLIESLGVASPFILAVILLVSCGLLTKFIRSN
jgi:sugar phosphate permease